MTLLTRLAAVTIALASLTACLGEPPELRYMAADPDPFLVGDDGTGNITDGDDGNRGAVWMYEVNWGGSYCYRNPNETDPETGEFAYADPASGLGNWFHDANDVFIELYNDDFFPIDMTRWQLRFEGSVNQNLQIPAVPRFLDEAQTILNPNRPVIQPGGFVLIVARENGAFIDPSTVNPTAQVPRVVIPNLNLPIRDMDITMYDADRRLIEGIGREFGDHLAGAQDGRVSRSMERTNDAFANDGNRDQAWHTYSGYEPIGDYIRPECRPRTFGSPGFLNFSNYGDVPDVSNPDDTLN